MQPSLYYFQKILTGNIKLHNFLYFLTLCLVLDSVPLTTQLCGSLKAAHLLDLMPRMWHLPLADGPLSCWLDAQLGMWIPSNPDSLLLCSSYPLGHIATCVGPTAIFPYQMLAEMMYSHAPSDTVLWNQSTCLIWASTAGSVAHY